VGAGHTQDECGIYGGDGVLDECGVCDGDENKGYKP
jgi:hypothetical protein